jgi:hypothetical protein
MEDDHMIGSRTFTLPLVLAAALAAGAPSAVMAAPDGIASQVAGATATLRARAEATAAVFRARMGAIGAPNRAGPTTVQAPEIDGAAGIQAIALLAGILLLAGEGARVHARRR